MKTHTANYKFFVFALLIILMVLGIQGISYGQNLNIGEPRTVRMIYFLPNDRPYRPEVVQNMKDMIRTLQTFFADQMETHGYGRKTFRFETDDKGEPKVHRVDGLHSDSYYLDNREYWQEVDQKFDRFAHNVYFLVWDNSKNTITSGVGGTGGGGKKHGQLAVPANFNFGLVAHELAHAFGLGHDFRDGKYILSYGPGWNQLSACAAEFLAVHPYFNANIPIEEGIAPTIELMSPRTYPAGSESVTIRLKVSDPDGVHQVLLFGIGNLIACRGLKGEKEAIVEFEYEGFSHSGGYIGISDAVSHTIGAHAVDTNADTSWIEFNLSEISQHHIHAFGDHTEAVRSLAFSPDGKKMASGGGDVAKLWDVATQQNIATFEGTFAGGSSIAFSPNGRILAMGSGYNVKLWDVATKRNIATLKVYPNYVYSLAFSPNGKMLASGLDEGMIKLWDVATQRDIFTFEAHKYMGKWTNNSVISLAFSPDGTLLASGTYDHIIKLWDVATWENIDSIRAREDKLAPYIRSLAFSPDGTLLASAIGNGPGSVELWDVSTKRNIASFHHQASVNSVAFSPDGRIIASGSREGFATLRNVSKGKKIIDLPHTFDVRSVAFSPDGTTLASGTSDGTINLWDVTSFLSQEAVDNRKKITISEIMVASNKNRLPQWIELHNRSNTHAVNLKGWNLEIQNYRSENFNGHQNVTLTLKEKTIKPQETLLILSKRGRASNQFRNEQIYNLNTLHPNLQDMVLSEEGFYLKLSNTAGELIDEVGNLDGKRNTNDKPAWSLPRSLTEEGARGSMIRRHDAGAPRLGTDASGWISAVNTKLATSTTTYYGHPDDIGAPGIESGGALPVALSRFRAERTDTGVIIKWITESELDNAGFNILRSETKDGEFKIVNPKLIQGAGTTSERSTYTWTDTTAKPNVVYYYRIEDISYAGVREQLATVRMRGYVSAAGKLTTKWGDLKLQE